MVTENCGCIQTQMAEVFVWRQMDGYEKLFLPVIPGGDMQKYKSISLSESNTVYKSICLYVCLSI